MSLHPTNSDQETGGVDPFAVSNSTDHAALQESVEIIDAPDGQAGWTTVTRTAGKPLDPNEKLSDAISYGPVQPGVTVHVRRGERR